MRYKLPTQLLTVAQNKAYKSCFFSLNLWLPQFLLFKNSPLECGVSVYVFTSVWKLFSQFSVFVSLCWQAAISVVPLFMLNTFGYTLTPFIFCLQLSYNENTAVHLETDLCSSVCWRVACRWLWAPSLSPPAHSSPSASLCPPGSCHLSRGKAFPSRPRSLGQESESDHKAAVQHSFRCGTKYYVGSKSHLRDCGCFIFYPSPWNFLIRHTWNRILKF